MRWTAFFLFFLLAGMAQAQLSPDSAIAQLARDPDLRGASIGFCLTDAGTGQVLADFDPERILTPASTFKIFTTLFAWEQLGKDFRYTTSLAYSGKIKDGILHGDLVITGSGDPSLGSKYFPSKPNPAQKWLQAVKAAGIQQVDGNVLADGSLFGTQHVPDTWIWEDIGNYYGAGTSGLNIYDNQADMHFSTGAPGSKARILRMSPRVPEIELENEVTAAAGYRDKCFAFGAPRQNLRIFRGTLPANQRDYVVKISLPNPTQTAADTLLSTLRLSGIAVSGKAQTVFNHTAPDSLEQIDSIKSPPLETLIHWTHLKSDNSYAEAILRTAAMAAQGTFSSDSSVMTLKAFWMGQNISPENFYPEDGCGLSRYTGVTAQDLCKALNFGYRQPWFNEYRGTLLRAGEDGSLRLVGKNGPAEGRVWAKSGYMERVRSYAGYAHLKSGRWVSFAIIVNNFSCTPSTMRVKMTRVINALAGE